MSIKDLDTQWEEFVNSFLFANYENLSLWVANRGASDGDLIYNYITFPFAENGKILTKNFLNFIIQSIENDEKLCNQIFGPVYELHSAKVYTEDMKGGLSIVWNIKKYEDDIELADNPTEAFNELYHWPVY